MQRFIFLLIIAFISQTIYSLDRDIKYYSPNEIIDYDTVRYMVLDSSFENSFKEMEGMFNGTIPYSLKRMEFLVENAYYGGNMNYSKFCQEIDSVVKMLNKFIDINNIRQYKTCTNYAIFEYFTKPSFMNGNMKFTYDFEDPMGNRDFTIFFTSRLMKTHKGQCSSLSVFYKMLCDELGGQSALAFGPMHVYIKHIGEDGRWVNVELTHGGFVRDVWLIESMNVSTEAIRNGVFLCALNEKETVGFMMMLLAKAYQSKYNSYDYYVERSVNTVLRELPDFCDALVLKLNLLQNHGLDYIEKYVSSRNNYLDTIYNEYKKVVNH